MLLTWDEGSVASSVPFLPGCPLLLPITRHYVLCTGSYTNLETIILEIRYL